MVIDNLALRTAQKQVANYDEESDHLIASHQQAMECADCEAYLQLGIDAFHWLLRADQEIRKSQADGLVWPDNIDDLLASLCDRWMAVASKAQQWVAMQIARGYHPENLVEFRNCCHEMQAIVDFNSRSGEETLPAPMAELQDKAIDENAHGETAEFI